MNFSWFIQAESYKKGMILSVGFNIIAKLLLFILTVCIARLFGTNIKTDIYFFIYGATILFSGSVNAIDTAVLIPESMQIRQQKGNTAATAFLNYFIRIYFVLGVAYVLLVTFFGTTIFSVLSKFSLVDINAYRMYFVLGSVGFLFQLLINYLSAILVSLKFFTAPMVVSVINSMIIILGSILLYKEYDVLSVLMSSVVAAIFNVLLLVTVLKKAARWNFLTSVKGIGKQVWNRVFFSQVAQVATLASSYFPLYLLSGFGSGVVSTMNYGKNIADIPGTLLTAQIAGVSGIKMNEQVAANDYESLNDTFIRSAKLLVFLLVPAGFFLFTFATPVIQLFYAAGNFTPQAVTAAAKFLQLLALTIFSVGINAMVARVFIATKSIKQALVYAVIMNGLLIAAIWIFSIWYGAYGYPYGIIFMNIVNVVGMFFICRIFFKNIQYGKILKYTVAIILLQLPVAIVLLYFVASADIFYIYKLSIGAAVFGLVMLLMNRIKMLKII